MSSPAQDAIVLKHAESPAEIEAIRQLWLEYANSLGFSLCFQNFEQDLANLPGEFGPPAGALILAQAGSEFAGCIALHARGGPGICEMKRLYVRPAFRRRNLGRLLAERLIADARAMDYSRMRLDTIPRLMGAAVELYRALGFREIAPYYTNPIEGASYMELTL
jgi:putative acetyltransferase